MRNKKISVCHVVTTLGVGGMENGIVNLANNHDRSKFDISICCLNQAGEMASRLKTDVKLHIMDEPEGFSLMRVFRMARLFRETRPDIVHTHAWGGGSFYGILGARLARVPVVINGEHGAFFTSRLQIFLQRILFRLCDFNLSVSASLVKNITRTLGVLESGVTVIRNGVDMEKYHGCHNREKIIHGLINTDCLVNVGDFNVVIVGSLKKEKAQLTLLKAMKKIADESTVSFNLLIVGDGPDMEELNRFCVDNSLGKNVIFLGVRNDIDKILSISDVLVSTSVSEHEGLPNVLLEAMSSGLPVIATRSVGTSELVEDGVNGFLINEGDIASLARYILALYQDLELRQRFGKKSREIIDKDFSLKKMVCDYERLYSGSLPI